MPEIKMPEFTPPSKMTGPSLLTNILGRTAPTYIEMPVPTFPHLRTPQKKALLIGISSSGKVEGSSDSPLPSLSGPHRDVEELEILLRSRGYKPENIVVMLDGSKDESMVPTHNNMVKQMMQLVKDAQPGDRLFFHFSGHSGEMTNRNNTEENGKDQALQSSDNVLIRDNDMKKYLVTPLPAGVVLIAVFDTCHSGTMLDLPHHKCNQVWVPWYSKGNRRTATRHCIQVRRDAVVATNDRPVRLTGDVYEYGNASFIPMGIALQDARRHWDMIEELKAKKTIFSFKRGAFDQPRRMSQSGSQSVRFGMETLIHTRGNPAGGQQWANSPDNWLGTPSSPIERSSSPAPVGPHFECDGWCREDGWQYCPAWQPHVISLSACKDSQFAWEDSTGKSMTQVLIEVLKKYPEPSMRDLMTHVSHRIHRHLLELHKAAREVRKCRGNPDFKLEKDNFQDPQLASLCPLDMDSLFIL